MNFVNESVNSEHAEVVRKACHLLDEDPGLVFLITSEKKLNCYLICFSVGNSRDDLGPELGRYALIYKNEVFGFKALRTLLQIKKDQPVSVEYSVSDLKISTEESHIKQLIRLAITTKELDYSVARDVEIVFDYENKARKAK